MVYPRLLRDSAIGKLFPESAKITSMDVTRLRRLLPAFLATMLLSPWCKAQDTDGTGEISGRVLSAETGQPIEHAEVTLDLPLGAPHTWKHQAITDKDGRYDLTWLPAGKFTVTASADKFVAQTFHHPDETDPVLAVSITLADAQSVSSIDFRLANAGSLHGSVVEQNGDPVGEGVSVSAAVTVNHGKTYEPEIIARTDATGHFVLPRLAPGVYRICVNGPDGYGFGPSKAKITYRETWLGDASNYDEAQTAEVRAGDAGADLRIIAPRIATHTLTVVPVWAGSEAVKPERYEASVAGRNHLSKSQPDGSASISDLTPGQYKVAVDAMQGEQVIGHGEAEVTVGDADSSVRVKVVNATPK